MQHDPVTVARQFAFVREAQQLGQNKGARVEAIQRWSLGSPGDSWCAEFATMTLDIAFQGDPPIPRLASCEAIRQLAAREGWLVATPSPGDLVLSLDANGHAHHVGICTVADPLTTVAGNTSHDGASSNGDGVYEHQIASTGKAFVHYPR